MSIELWLSEHDAPGLQTELQRAVWKELKWDASLDATNLSVEVADSVVRLRGSVRSYLECRAAERAASRVRGVRAVRNEVYVEVPAAHTRTDTELTAEVRRALECSVAIPADRLAVSVEAGCVVLEGMVDRDAQRRKSEDVVAGLVGVRHIANQITLAPQPPLDPDIKAKVAAALVHAGVQPRRCRIDFEGSHIVLRGRVRSLAERTAAEYAVCDVPGVSVVEDELQVAG